MEKYEFEQNRDKNHEFLHNLGIALIVIGMFITIEFYKYKSYGGLMVAAGFIFLEYIIGDLQRINRYFIKYIYKKKSEPK